MKDSNNIGKPNLPRGLRNNNPGNLRKSSSTWIGKLSPGQDSSFEQFKTIALGLRAMLKLLQTYIGRGNNTIAKILPTYAPSSDGNNTQQYIIDVEKWAGIGRNTVISANDKSTLIKVANAMVRKENGNSLNTGYFETAWQILPSQTAQAYANGQPLPNPTPAPTPTKNNKIILPIVAALIALTIWKS